jgi:acyl-CoA oxidase
MIRLWEDNLPNLFKEKNRITNLCHGLCSNLKIFGVWDGQDTASECRRACGGLGYLKSSLFSEILNINDLNQTWEGDNHVLMMQSQQFLFKCMSWLGKGDTLPETVEWLSLSPPDLEDHNSCIFDLKGLRELFAARACHLVHKASHIMMMDPTKTAENFIKFQQFELRDMCQGYHDIFLIDTFLIWLETINDSRTKTYFEKLLLAFMHKKIINDKLFFTKCLGEDKLEKTKLAIIKELKEIRKDIVTLTDVAPFPNWTMGALGNEDLQIYDRVLQHVKATPKVSERPDWWKLTYSNSEQHK